jgi:predicted GNAT family acetyltransferase
MTETTEVRIVRDDAAGRFEAYDGDVLAGLVTFRATPGRIELVHTEVKPEFRGRGIGEQLAGAALNSARSAGEAVVPTCPFIAAYMREHPEFEELRAS